MLRHAESLPANTVIDADVCIVGCGIAGTTLALELANDRRRVVVLEGGVEERTEWSDDLYRGDSIGHPYFDLDECRTRALGGSGNCWGGYCRMFEDFEFDHRPAIPHSGWPLTLDEIMPYYDRAHAWAKLGPMDYTLDYWARRAPDLEDPFAGGPIKTGIFQQSMFDGHLYRDDLRRAKNIDVYLGANVVEVEVVDDASRASAVRARGRSGPEFRVRAPHYVLAAGGVENARLLLLSDSVRPDGLANEHGLVGRYFMDHLNFRVGTFRAKDPTFHERYFKPWHEVAGTILKTSAMVDPEIRRQEQLLRTFFELSPQMAVDWHGRKSFVFIRDQLRQRAGVRDWRYHVANVWADRGRLFDHALHARMPGISRRLGRDPWRRGIELLVSSEPSPNPDSRVRLSERRDALGLRRVELDWRINDLDRQHVARSVGLFARNVEEQDLGTVAIDDTSTWSLWGHNHHIGTTRMSTDPRRGVVDANSTVHGIPNLHIAGSSVFPTAGGGSVTLLTIALATRLADHLATVLR